MVVSMFGDPQSMQQGGSSLSSTVIAKVDGEEITLQAVFQAVNNQRAQQQEAIDEQVSKSANKAETRKFLDQLLKMQLSSDRVLAEMINQKFSERISDRLGLEAPTDAVVSMIHSLPYFQKDGKFDPVRYKSMVSQPGRYEDEIRKSVLIESLRKSFISSLSVLSPEEQKIEASLKKRYNFEVLSVSQAALKEAPVVSDVEIATYMNDASQQANLQAYFDKNSTKYNTEAQIQARHILIDEASGGEKKAAEILADIKAGKVSFEDAAKKFSTDKSNAAKGGDLGFFGKGAMKPSFEAAAFALKNDNDLTDKPIKTDFGFHLIQRLGFRPATTKKLADVKKEVASAMLTESRKSEQVRQWAVRAAEGNAPSDADLKKMGMSWTPASWTALDSSLGPISNIGEHRAALLNLTSSAPYFKEPIRQSDTTFAVVRLSMKKDDKAADSEGDLSPSKLAQDKAFSALGYFMQEERTRLEKAKKIVKNEGALAQLKKSLGDDTPNDFGGFPMGSP